MPESPTLTGYYKHLFLYLEPCKQACGAARCVFTEFQSLQYTLHYVFIYPGAQAFYDGLIPGSAPSSAFEPPREDGHLAVGKLCVEFIPCVILQASQAIFGDSGYFLLSLMSSFVFRAVRNSVPSHVSQE